MFKSPITLIILYFFLIPTMVQAQDTFLKKQEVMLKGWLDTLGLQVSGLKILTKKDSTLLLHLRIISGGNWQNFKKVYEAKSKGSIWEYVLFQKFIFACDKKREQADILVTTPICDNEGKHCNALHIHFKKTVVGELEFTMDYRTPTGIDTSDKPAFTLESARGETVRHHFLYIPVSSTLNGKKQSAEYYKNKIEIFLKDYYGAKKTDYCGNSRKDIQSFLVGKGKYSVEAHITNLSNEVFKDGRKRYEYIFLQFQIIENSEGIILLSTIDAKYATGWLCYNPDVYVAVSHAQQHILETYNKKIDKEVRTFLQR
jgi:hypothetical protein